MEAQAVTQRGASPNPSPDTVFRSGTRLVEVEVVVRDQNGPITALTPRILPSWMRASGWKSPFSTQAIPTSVRRVFPAQLAAIDLPLTVSRIERVFDHGATVLLLDQRNAAFDNQGYARSQMLKFLESHQAEEPVAIYLLGKKLTVVQDFTDEHDSLSKAVRRWKPETSVS